MQDSDRYRRILDALEAAQAHQSLAGDATESIQEALRLCRDGINAQALEDMRKKLAIDGIEAGTATAVRERRFAGQPPRFWISKGYLVGYDDHESRIAMEAGFSAEVRRGMRLLKCFDVGELDILILEIEAAARVPALAGLDAAASGEAREGVAHAERIELVWLLGELQTHLESYIESACDPTTGQPGPADAERVDDARILWAKAEDWVRRFDVTPEGVCGPAQRGGDFEAGKSLGRVRP